MFSIPGAKIEAIFGCVPRERTDNLSACMELLGDAKKSEAIVAATGFRSRVVAPKGTSVVDLVMPAACAALSGVDTSTIGAVIFVTFSAPDRFPAAACAVHHALGLSAGVAAFDVSMACSGYPYGLFLASQFASVTGRRVLLLDGDIQTAYVNPSDSATVPVMSDAATATLVAPGGEGAAKWMFDFFTDSSGRAALNCEASGKISMDGFKVFSFVARPVAKFLSDFLSATDSEPNVFVPHQANMYMVRQLAKSLGFDGDKLWTSGEKFGNPGSSSVPLTVASQDIVAPDKEMRLFIAAFGGGLSASAASVTLSHDCRRGVIDFPEVVL